MQNEFGLSPYRNWREERRFVAWELKQHGWKQKRIAEVLDVTPGAVSRWLTQAEKQGREALRIGRRGVATVRWTEEKRKCIPRLLARMEQLDRLM